MFYERNEKIDGAYSFLAKDLGCEVFSTFPSKTVLRVMMESFTAKDVIAFE